MTLVLAFLVLGSAPADAAVGVPAASTSPVSVTAATRILDETTFGPTLALIDHVQAEGLDAWLTEQFATPQTELPLVPFDFPNDELPSECPSIGFCVKTEWWRAALDGQDQLRQRVALALSQIFVVSDASDHALQIPYYANTLAGDAFTNWRTIMTDVTLAPAMGTYLNMVNSGTPAPGQIANENFARENMQLFNLGLYKLQQDGTPQADNGGNLIPAFTETQVQAFAKVFTGWTYTARYGTAPTAFSVDFNYDYPMSPVESEHDESGKPLLDGTGLPPGQTAEEDLNAALDNIFQDPNVPPFVSRQLIQKLVTGAPNPGYVARVAKVFTDNGQGVRGDMKSVLKAILSDPDARAGDTGQPAAHFGHLRDPLTWTTHLLRAVGYTNTDPNGFYDRLWFALVAMGDAEYDANSVFNFYPPNYLIPGTEDNEPEFDLESTGEIGLRRSLADSLLNNKIPGITINLGPDSPLVKAAANPAGLADTLGLLFAHGRLNTQIRSVVIDEMAKSFDPAQRARLAIYLISTAPAYKVEN